MNLSKTAIIFLMASMHLLAMGQAYDTISIPKFKDKYSNYVKMMESGNVDIDYKDFRFSFLDSKQYQIKVEKRQEYDSLKKEMFVQAGKSNYTDVMRLAKAMLNIDYSSQYAHKYLQQTYKIIGDTPNRNKYHNIEFGLIYSITKSGDSKTCETSWEVIQIEEEYFVLEMIGLELQQQSIEKSGGKVCDKMVVKTEDSSIENYYFDVSKIFAKHPK